MLARRFASQFRRVLSSHPSSLNHYQVLGINESFDVDLNDLANRFKRLQGKWHPDKFANEPSVAQENAATMSARLNEAYSILRAPHERAKHLLEIRSATDQSQIMKETQLPAEFLMWVMQFREEISDAVGDEDLLSKLNRRLRTTMDACLHAVGDAFERNDIEAAALETAKLQYLRRIRAVIDDS